MEGNMFITSVYRSFVVALGAVIVAGGVVVSGSAFANRAEAQAFVPCAGTPLVAPLYGAPAVETKSTDPVGPFPLSTLMPFPWKTIEGVWAMKLPDGTPLQFSFEVQADCDGRRYIEVLGFNRDTYQIQASGYAVALAGDTMVRAVMTSGSSQYMIYIRQFKMLSRGVARYSMVVTMRPFNGDETNDVHMTARKISPLPLAEFVRKIEENSIKRDAR
jgi:hypothetical protein